MRFAILASGSKGNAALVEHKNKLVLLDCGLSYKMLREKMEIVGARISDITDVLLTHEHSDHIVGLEKFVKETGNKPHMTHGTSIILKLGKQDFIPIRAGSQVDLGDGLIAMPYAIPHDAREAVHFRFHAEGAVLAFATDIGKANGHISEILEECNALVLECNYEDELLDNNLRYPHHIKQRIKGDEGHLSNEQAGRLLSKIAWHGLSLVVAAHLSDNNNNAKLAKKALLMGLKGTNVSLEVKNLPAGHNPCLAGSGAGLKLGPAQKGFSRPLTPGQLRPVRPRHRLWRQISSC